MTGSSGPLHHLPPELRIGEHGEIARAPPPRTPRPPAHAHGAQPVRDGPNGKHVQEPRVEQAKLVRIEPRRARATICEVESRHKLIEARMRRDRIRGPERRGVARDRERLDPAARKPSIASDRSRFDSACPSAPTRRL